MIILLPSKVKWAEHLNLIKSIFCSVLKSIQWSRIAQSIQWLGYGLDNWGWVPVRDRGRAGNISLRHRVQTGDGAQPASQRIPVALSPGLKRPGRHHSPSSTEVKNGWSYTFIPPHAFISQCSVTHRGNLTFYHYVGKYSRAFIWVRCAMMHCTCAECWHHCTSFTISRYLCSYLVSFKIRMRCHVMITKSATCHNTEAGRHLDSHMITEDGVNGRGGECTRPSPPAAISDDMKRTKHGGSVA
jgi:hypothetical protein